jgi:glycine cleavage system aminomethyltransferase T
METLQDGIDKAGSPVKLLWRPDAPPFTVPVLPPEFSGWRQEQTSWRETAAFMNQSFHMRQIYVEGPDAKRMLSEISVNDYEDFVIGRAKQFVPVTPRGHIITDAIVMRLEENRFVVSGVAAAETWVRYHAASGRYDVTFLTDPNSGNRFAEPNYASPGMAVKGQEPMLFRYQVQGPAAMEIVTRALGGPPPEVKFFHSAPVEMAGATFRAFRHGMAGMPGFEFIGDYRHAQAVKDHLLEAGASAGIVEVGGLAYFTGGVESGWMPIPTPGIYTGDELADYRRFVGLHTYEGNVPLQGSYYSDDIEDYYVTPYELGYGRLINTKHEFIGKEALLARKDQVRRTKVTLLWDEEDVRRVLGKGAEPDFFYTHAKHRLEIGGELVGYTPNAAYIHGERTVIALAYVDLAHAEPGTRLEVVFGQHPGPGAPADAHRDFPRIKAVITPTPFNAYARTRYRENASA